MLLSHSIRFGSTAIHKEIWKGKVGAPHGNFGTGERVFKAFVYNDGPYDVVVTLDGASDDAGYGQNWTNRASATIKAGGNGMITGCIRGTETFYRFAVISADGASSGRLECFDVSNNLLR